MQGLEEALAVQADQVGGAAGVCDHDLISAVQFYVVFAVKIAFRIERLAVAGRQHFNGDAVIRGQDNAAVIEGVGADRCKKDQSGFGFYNGTARRHAVGG